MWDWELTAIIAKSVLVSARPTQGASSVIWTRNIVF